MNGELPVPLPETARAIGVKPRTLRSWLASAEQRQWWRLSDLLLVRETPSGTRRYYSTPNRIAAWRRSFLLVSRG